MTWRWAWFPIYKQREHKPERQVASQMRGPSVYSGYSPTMVGCAHFPIDGLASRGQSCIPLGITRYSSSWDWRDQSLSHLCQMPTILRFLPLHLGYPPRYSSVLHSAIKEFLLDNCGHVLCCLNLLVSWKHGRRLSSNNRIKESLCFV